MLTQRPQQPQQSYPYSLPTPTRGWNASDPITKMKETDAIALDNIFPREQEVELRKGSAAFATVPSGVVVRSFLPYNTVTGTRKLFAAGDDGIYDVTSGGDVVSEVETVSSNEWESVNVTTAGGNYLFCVCGDATNDARHYNGTIWATPTITGVASNLFTAVTLHKKRLMFTEKDSLSFWYLPVNAIAGAATEFPLGSVFTRGGYLVKIVSWSLDGGSGIDDMFAAITSEGEIAIYEGSDPNDVESWWIVGVFTIAKPIGKRCTVQLAGDVGIITEAGMFPISEALNALKGTKKSAITSRVNTAFRDMAESFKSRFGWEALYFPVAPFILINIPTASGTSYQFVMNADTGAWCRFTGWTAECFGVSGDGLYFANDNVITQAWTGYNDLGNNINTLMIQAYSPLGRRNFLKHIPLLKPILRVGSSFGFIIGLTADYDTSFIGGSASSYTTTLALWGTAIFNNAVWGSSNTIVGKWATVAHKPGRMLSLRFQASTKNIDYSLQNFDFICQKGGMF